jgi:hypothetical protein
MAVNAKQMLDWAKNGDVKQTVANARQEAVRRGHGQQTAFAGAGGLLGAILGSFRGTGGAAFGALLGALLGAVFGQRRDRNTPQLARASATRAIVRGRPRTIVRAPAVEPVAREYVDVIYAD